MPNFLNALMDPQFRRDVAGNLNSTLARGLIAQTLGAPADIANLGGNALRAGVGYLGHKTGLLRTDQLPELVDHPVGGSEWIGQQMQQRGLINSNRNTVAEMLAGGMLAPAGGASLAARSPQIASAMIRGGENLAVPATLGKQRGVFAGSLAETADLAARDRAMELLSKGVPEREVYGKTGWFRGPDGKMRFEIDDSAAKLRDYQYTPKEAFENARANAAIGSGDRDRAMSMQPYAGKTKSQLVNEYSDTGGDIVAAAQSGDSARAMQLIQDRSGLDNMMDAMRDRTYGPMSSFLKHGELGAAYPDVYKMHTRVGLGDEMGAMRGRYTQAAPGIGEQINLRQRPVWSDDKSTMLHETQHAIQAREGFAGGGTPQSFKDATPQAQFDQYQRLGGEAEARAVQARMNLTPEQRRATYPLDSYDVPLDQIINRPANGPSAAIDVYHGSPHSFDKFQMDRIGTGEGAQAYGHGLYFAENPTVATDYQKVLAGRWDKVSIKGAPLEDQSSDIANAIRSYQQDGGNFAKWKKETAARMRGAATNGPGAGRPERAKELIDAADAITNLRAADIKNTGNLYETRLAWPDAAREAKDPLGPQHFLQWDRPLSEQPAVANIVREAIRPGYVGGKYIDPFGSGNTGGAMLNDLQTLANKSGQAGFRTAETALRKAGIPGIRYMDQGSRGAGTGTANYVVFSDDIPKIINRK